MSKTLRTVQTEAQVRQGPHLMYSAGESTGEGYITLPFSGAHWNDRKLLISGVGHSGSNLLTDMVRAAEYYNFTPMVEDRMMCDAWMPLYIKNYATKLCLDSPYWDMNKFKLLMDKFPNMKVMLAIRHPVDQMLSWIYRELPVSMGGDSLEIKEADVDHQLELKIARWNSELLQNTLFVLNEYGHTDRALGYKMEDIISNTKLVAMGVAQWLEIPYSDFMAKPWEISRHEGQLHRYKRKLNKDQVDVYKRWETEYNGFYADKRDMVAFIMENLQGVSASLGYAVDMGVI